MEIRQIVLISVVALVLLIFLLVRRKPHARLLISEYTDKDAYFFEIFTPLEDLKKHRYIRVEIVKQRYLEESPENRESYNDYNEG